MRVQRAGEVAMPLAAAGSTFGRFGRLREEEQ